MDQCAATTNVYIDLVIRKTFVCSGTQQMNVYRLSQAPHWNGKTKYACSFVERERKGSSWELNPVLVGRFWVWFQAVSLWI